MPSNPPKVYTSHYPPPRVPTDLSLPQWFAAYNPDGVANDKVILEDDFTDTQITFGGLKRDAKVHAGALRALFDVGTKAGDVIGICGLNSVAHVQAIHAVLYAGATAACLSALNTQKDFEHCFEITSPKVVIVDASIVETVQAALERRKQSDVPVVVLGEHSPRTRRSANKSFPEDFTSSPALPLFDLPQGDNRKHTAIICFSSGTSGKSKGVALTHFNLIASLAGIRSSDPVLYNSSGRGVFFAPLCHIYGLNTVALIGTWLGSYTMLMRKYTLPSFLELSARVHANCLRIVPPIALAMTKDPALEKYDLGSVTSIMCSGAALQQDVIEALQRRFDGAPIFQGYGMTETNIATLRAHESQRVGSVGRLFANVEARLVDDCMNDVQPGQEGEMLVRGPTVFSHYVGNPTATKEAFHQGWMKTGDVLRIDADGFLYLTERKKELIKYKGMQVAPAELEGILTSHPFVNEGVVCASWDQNQGTEVPIAYVTLSQTGESMVKSLGLLGVLFEIRQFVDAKVSPYKKIRGGVHLLDEIPKTASGKILRRLLPARLERSRHAKI